MRRWFDHLTAFVRTAWQVGLTVYLAWLLWKRPITNTGLALWHTTVSAAIQALAVGGGIALLVYLLGRRYQWPSKTVYWFISRLLKEPYKSRLAEINSAMGGVDHYAFFIRSDHDHWLVAKVEEWITRILTFLFWPTLCVSVGGDIYDEPVLEAIIWTVVVLFFLALVGLKLRYLLAASLMGVWLEHVSNAYGHERLLTQAALLGVCLVLWGLWQQWRDRIVQQPPPAQPVAE
jgi:hypothetical protein